MRIGIPVLRGYISQPPSAKQWQISQDLSSSTRAVAGAVCSDCHMPFGLVLEANSTSVLWQWLQSESVDQIDSKLASVSISTVPRSAAQIEFLGDLPEKLRKPFEAANEDAARKRNPAGIMAVCRGCLDVALKELGEVGGGRRDRINNLATKGVITHGIAEWAQALWEEGSDAVHDLDASIERAIDHVEFLKLFFEVAFALPERIKRASHGGVATP